MNLVLGVTINPGNPACQTSFPLSKHRNTAANAYAKHLYAAKNVFKTTTKLGGLSCLKQSSQHDKRVWIRSLFYLKTFKDVNVCAFMAQGKTDKQTLASAAAS